MAGVFGYQPAMQGAQTPRLETAMPKGAGSEIFRDGLGLYSALVIGGIAMNATQMLVIAIIMPTIVRDIGGAGFYSYAGAAFSIGTDVCGGPAGKVGVR